MKKTIFKFLMAILFLVMPLSLSSCNLGGGFLPQGDNEEENNNNNSDKQVELILVDRSTVPEKIIAGQFFNVGIMLSVYYSDDSYERVTVTKSMVSPESQVMLNQPGIHTIYIEYAAKRTSLTVTIVSQNESREITVNYYAYVETDEYVLIKTQQVEDVSAATAPAIHKQVYTDTLHYSFVSWQRQEESDTLINFYAQYRCSKYYIVNFYNYYGTIIKTQKIDEGNPATAPNMSLYPVEGYEFKGWDVEFNNVTTNLEVHPIYEEIPVVVPPEPEEYTITYYALPETGKFTIHDYIVVGTVQVLDYETAVPPKVASECYSSTQHFTFKGWGNIQFIGSDSSHECNCFAQYDICNYYTVKFYNFSSEIISTQRIDEGASATAPDMSLYPVLGYDFKGWDVEFNNVTTNLNVYPVYEKTGGSQQSENDYFITKPTTITVKTTFNDTYGQILQEAAADLMKKEPNLTINYEKFSGPYSALKDDVVSGAPAGNYPDVVAVYPDSVVDFIESGIVFNLDPYINSKQYGFSQEELNDFYQVYLDEGKNYPVSGTYSLPLAKSTEAMYYDGDKILGLVLPGVNGGNAIDERYINNLTWEELFDVLCPALLAYRETLSTDAEKKAFLDIDTYADWAVAGYDSDDNLFVTLAEQYGYGYTSLDLETGSGQLDFVNDGMKNLMKTFNSAYKNHYFTTKGIIGTNVNNRSTVDALLFSIGSTGGVNYQFLSSNPKNIRVAPIPHAEGKGQKAILQGPSMCLLNHGDSNRALASWLFYKEFAETQRQIQWSTTTNYSPIRQSVSESDDYLEFSNETIFGEKTLERLKAFNAQYASNYVDILFSTPVFGGSSEARTQVGGLATKAIGAESLTDEYLNSLFQDAYNNTIMKMRNVSMGEISNEGSMTLTNYNEISEIMCGDSARLLLDFDPAINVAAAITLGDLVITSSDPSVASVSGLYINALLEGTAVININYKDIYVKDYQITVTRKLSLKEKYGTTHEGTLEDPLTNEDALLVAKAQLSESFPTFKNDIYIKGEVDHFYISHLPGSNQTFCSFYLRPEIEGGEKFEGYKITKQDGSVWLSDDIWVGATVTIKTNKLAVYNGQYETNTGILVSVEGDKPEPPQTIEATIAEALEEAGKLASGYTSYDKYVVEGYITSITQQYDANYKNISFNIGTTAESTEVIFAYRCVSTEELATQLVVGARVRITGNLQNNNGTYRFALGCTVEIIA